MKTCTKCGEAKAFAEYYKMKSGRFGLQAKCKACHCSDIGKHNKKNKAAKQEYSRQYYKDNAETITAASRECYHNNKEKRTEYNQSYYLNNKDVLVNYSKNYYQENAEKAKADAKKYREANKEKVAKTQRAYRLANREALNKKDREYRKKRRANDPLYKMIGNLYTGLNKAMKGTAKPKRTMKLLGCSSEQFRDHLSSQFTDGMTLENYGLRGWHIDHIQPVDSFDHSDPEQVEVCWHHTNMQPMWWRDNIIKSDMLPHEWEEFKRQRQAVSL